MKPFALGNVQNVGVEQFQAFEGQNQVSLLHGSMSQRPLGIHPCKHHTFPDQFV